MGHDSASTTPTVWVIHPTRSNTDTLRKTEGTWGRTSDVPPRPVTLARRPSAAAPWTKTALFGVLDGHGGAQVHSSLPLRLCTHCSNGSKIPFLHVCIACCKNRPCVTLFAAGPFARSPDLAATICPRHGPGSLPTFSGRTLLQAFGSSACTGKQLCNTGCVQERFGVSSHYK